MSDFFSKPYPKTLNQKASILVNGPSLNESFKKDLSFIQDSEIYCVNFFSISEWFTQIKPHNYVLLDPAFFFSESQLINRPDVINSIDYLYQKTDWNLNLFIPYTGRKSPLVEKIKKNKFINVIFYNYTIFNSFNFIKHWVYKHRLGTPRCQNVLGICLYLGITRKKHSEIYLFGADHSWHETIKVDEEGIQFKDVHFYDKEEVNYRTIKKNQSDKIMLSEQFGSMSKIFSSYEIMNNYSNYMNVKIYNASFKTYIDAFIRVKL